MGGVDDAENATGERREDDASTDGNEAPTSGDDTTPNEDTTRDGDGTTSTEEATRDGDDHTVFELLGHEMRLAIVERLAEERRTAWQPRGLRFAELRKAVGVRDAGQFNYHLDKLVGTFVFHRDDEYVLTTGGMEVAGTLKAGTYGGDADAFDVELDKACVACDEALRASYDRGRLLVRCDEHGIMHANSLPPAAASGRDPESVVSLATLNAKNQLQRALEGACVHCWGNVDVETPTAIPDTVDDEKDAEEVEQVLVEFECADCGMTFWTPASVTVVRHPAVVSFYHDHDVDIREVDYLDLGFVDGTNGEVVSADPIRVRVDVTLDDDELHLWLDDGATVVDYERA